MSIDLRKLAFVILIVGSLMRLVWPADMEWKADEIWMYETSARVAAGGEWPPTGIASSVGLKNPGMSVWLFILMAKVAHSPIAMVLCVQSLNVLALWMLFAFVCFQIPIERRAPWLWGLMLASISPLPILFSRKLWAQCLLPPFCVFFLWGHWNRDQRAGALVWGIVGAVLGQIHMSGFFFSFAILVWTLLKLNFRTIRWGFWFLGSLLGSLGLVPWVSELSSQFAHHSGGSSLHLPDLRFYSHWVANALGIGMKYSLGSGFFDFLKSPVIGGIPTFLMLVCHLFLLGCGIFWLARLIGKPYRTSDRPYQLLYPEMGFYIGATFVATGLAMTLSGISVYGHYLIIAFPFVHGSLALGLIRYPKLLMKIVLAQMLISMGFLFYIHVHGGEPRGDYGVVFRLRDYHSSLSKT
jgi:hypothetical protein